MADTILVTRAGPIATVTLNRPDKLNALTRAMWGALGEAIDALSADDALRCVIVRGAGEKAFSPGNDIAEFATERSNKAQAIDYGRIMHAIWDDLCRAHVVLADLTGANLNVMIELGMAHAIGRPLLAVRRSDAVDVRPKNIEKLRVLRYDSPSHLMALLLAKWPG